MTISLFLPQVTRIPITGPAPYNTLVCVQTEQNFGPQYVNPGKLSRWSFTAPTTFTLAGFDQRASPVFDHSTTAFINTIGPAEDDTWLYAVDAVTGAGFDSHDGTYYVNVDVAMSPGKPDPSECFFLCFYLATIQITSFVLCNEPPVPPPPPQPPGWQPPISAKMASIVLRERGLTVANQLIERLGLPGTAPVSSSTSPTDAKPGPCKCK